MQKAINHKNTQLTYYTYGKGLPVVLLHGFAETSSVWQKQINALSKYCNVIVPDLPGSGKSSAIKASYKKIRIEDFADAVYSIIINENIHQCIMLGHSMGGYITLAFAEKYQNKLMAFGFVHSTAFADSKEKKQNRLKAISVIENYGSYSFLKTALPVLFSADFKKKHAAIINAMVKKGKNFEALSLQQYYYAMMQRPDRTYILKSTKLPVLFVIGIEDHAAPLNDVLKQACLPEIAYIHILKKCGHMGMLEKPAALNKLLKNFIHASE